MYSSIFIRYDFKLFDRKLTDNEINKNYYYSNNDKDKLINELEKRIKNYEKTIFNNKIDMQIYKSELSLIKYKYHYDDFISHTLSLLLTLCVHTGKRC